MCCDDDSNLKVPRASFLGVINKLFLHVLVKRARLERGARRDWSLASALFSFLLRSLHKLGCPALVGTRRPSKFKKRLGTFLSSICQIFLFIAEFLKVH